jgi:NADH-quinone oxidoreductase subunit C
MDSTALLQALGAAVPDARIEQAATIDLQTTIYAVREDVPAVAELTAVDRHPREPRFEIIYILVSIEHRMRLRLKVALDGSDARIRTVSDIWPAANWLEREVWDLFGIVFVDHPDPRRLLMPEDWEGYPLRKDYPVQIRMTPRTTEALQVTEEEFRANVERDRLARRE